MEKTELISKLRNEIIEVLNLEIDPATFNPDTPLFGDAGIGLDSIDTLEIVVLLDSHYGIRVKDTEDGKQIFYSLNSLADYIISKKYA